MDGVKRGEEGVQKSPWRTLTLQRHWLDEVFTFLSYRHETVGLGLQYPTLLCSGKHACGAVGFQQHPESMTSGHFQLLR